MLKIPQLRKILIIRTDRIGDVVLSLPMIQALKSAIPQSSIGFLLRSYTKELVEGNEGVDDIILYDYAGVRKPFRTMLVELRRNNLDAVIITYPTFRLALLTFLARIPIRVGTGYRWYSFLFNRRVFEHRKTAEKHESEYNLGLLKALGLSFDRQIRPVLGIPEEERRRAKHFVAGLGISENDVLVVLHPGSGGSARDWSAARFGELADRLCREGKKVLVTEGPGEQALVKKVIDRSGGRAVALPAVLSLKSLSAVLLRANVFVSNSTGPLHMAAAVGTPVVAFYPPIRQCSPQRWGPLTERKVVFEPDPALCPRCHGTPCQGDDCMDLITVDQAQDAVNAMIARFHKKDRKYEPA